MGTNFTFTVSWQEGELKYHGNIPQDSLLETMAATVAGTTSMIAMALDNAVPDEMDPAKFYSAVATVIGVILAEAEARKIHPSEQIVNYLESIG